MAGGLQDIGGGIKILNVDAMQPSGGTGSGLSDQIRLLEFAQKQKEAPLREKKLNLEVKEKEQQLLLNEMKNLKDQADLYYKLQNEERARRKEDASFFTEFVSFAKDNPNAAPGFLKNISPESNMVFNQDGTATITMPKVKRLQFGEDGKFAEVVSDEQVPIVINPGQLSQERRIQVEKDYSNRFEKSEVVQNYQRYFSGLQRIKALASKGTGAGDIGIVNVFARTIQGGTGIVTESDVENAMKTVGLSAQWANALAKAWKDNAPIFGDFEYNPDGSVKNIGQARKNFVGALDSIVNAAREDALSY